jgi:uncharacterized protein (DUF2147 family)
MMKMRLFLVAFLIGVFGTIGAQTVEGVWFSVDDETKEKKSEITVYLKDGKVYGKITSLLLSPNDTPCENCPGDLKDTPYVGLEIITGLSKSGKSWKGGKILDPESGKYYKCLITLEGPNKLKVRGYIGIQALGRTQYWLRKG